MLLGGFLSGFGCWFGFFLLIVLVLRLWVGCFFFCCFFCYVRCVSWCNFLVSGCVVGGLFSDAFLCFDWFAMVKMRLGVDGVWFAEGNVDNRR